MSTKLEISVQPMTLGSVNGTLHGAITPRGYYENHNLT